MAEQTHGIPNLPPRAENSHKGNFGRALLIGGSRGMTGAIAMAGMSTLRSGAGLVSLAVPDRCLEVVASLDPCYMTTPLPCDGEGRLAGGAGKRIMELADKMTAVACGPGLGRSDELDCVVRMVYVEVPLPMVCDADGLNALSHHPEGLPLPAGPRILTPHPGEFGRLTGGKAAGDADRERLAIELAASRRAVVVLKGHRTLVTDGQRWQRNETGNPGMATAGAGASGEQVGNAFLQ
ncbi:MAG: NAD(P)H-hydrate dehydratase [Pirellulaceae bacterium]